MLDLCSCCAQIPFHVLACPFLSDIDIARTARIGGRKFRPYLPTDRHGRDWAEGKASVSLGSLSRIRRDSSICGLCRLISRTIHRQGAVYMHDKAIPTDDQATFYANTDREYYGFVTVSPLDGEGDYGECYFVLRRLSVSGELHDHDAGQGSPPYVAFSHILQAYQPVSGTAVEGHGMLFGGRIRPQTIDLDLLRRWIRICDSQHEVTCSHKEVDAVQS